MGKNTFFKDDFSDSTKQKLAIYGSYLESALPVFLMTPWVNEITVYDFFSGPGENEKGEDGSPKVAVEAIQRVLSTVEQAKPIRVLFNEIKGSLYKKLSAWAQSVSVPGVVIETSNKPFAEAFAEHLPKMQQANQASLILMDQFGVAQVTEDIFKDLAYLHFADFLFFLASSHAYRFKDQLLQLLPKLTSEELAQITAQNAHSFFANAYKNILPEDSGCYLGRYTLKRESNYYGLVFGSHSPKGLEKFLETVWRLSPEYGGLANYDWAGQGISPLQPTLFDSPEWNIPKNILDFREAMANKIRHNILITDSSLYIDGLWHGLRPRDVKTALQLLVQDQVIPKQKIAVSYKRWKEIREGKRNPTPLQTR